MPHEPERPFSDSDLESVEYRERLMRKLNCLIAVLEVAGAKVRRSLAAPAADVERLTRIKKNLQDTLDVCLRAKTALEKRGALPPGLGSELSQAVDPRLVDVARLEAPARQPAARGRAVELASARERAKFARLAPIEPAMVWSCDLDELAARLQDD